MSLDLPSGGCTDPQLRGDRLSPTEKKLYMQIVTVIPAKVVEERFPKDKNTWLPVPSK